MRRNKQVSDSTPLFAFRIHDNHQTTKQGEISMAHDLNTASNGMVRMFCVGDVDSAWHGLGQRTPDAATAEQAIQLAGLDWNVIARDMYARNPQQSVTKIEGFKSIWREGDDPTQLGVVGEDYKIIQNRDAFNWMDSVIGSLDGAHYESAGFLNSGKLWILARVPSADIVVGESDLSLSYLLVQTSHDGSCSYLSKLCSTRVVCQNTLTIALGEDSTTLKIKHTKNADVRMKAVSRFAATLAKDAKDLEARLNFLATRRVTRESAEAIFDRLFPKPDNTKNSTRRDNVLARVMELYDLNNGDVYADQRGSGYNLLNAVTEYTDWERGIRQTDNTEGMSEQQIRKASALFGSGESFKTEALEVITEMLASAPPMMAAKSKYETVSPVPPSGPEIGGLLGDILNNVN